MALPVDTTKLSIICGAPPEALRDYQSGELRKNREGEQLFRTEIVVMGFGRPQVCAVRTAKEPKGLALGAPVTVSAFSVSSFQSSDGGTGVYYEAERIEPARATRETAS